MANRWQDDQSSGPTQGPQSQSWNQGSSSDQSGSGRGSQSELIWQNRLQKQVHEAEQNEQDGALTAGYKADPREIVSLLVRAQASEWSSFLQYWHHYFMASDIHSVEVKNVFKEHAEDEYEHARFFGERIQQLGGVPCDKPEDIARLTPTPVEYNHDLRSMMEAD
ncbi:MAG: ferritin-like domain-containing protein, partial [Chloroflexota bacterium]